MTQNERVLWHLKNIGRISCRDAAYDYGIMALHSRIADLRKDGWNIASEHKSGVNKMGDRCGWYEYWLVEP